jgi:hypothetical protein
MPGAGVVHHIKDGRRAKRDTCSTFPGHFLTAASAAARSRLKGMAGDTSMRDTDLMQLALGLIPPWMVKACAFE